MNKFKRILSLTLIMGIILSAMSFSSITASASCPLTNILFRNFSGFNSSGSGNSSNFGGLGSLFSNFINDSGNNCPPPVNTPPIIGNNNCNWNTYINNNCNPAPQNPPVTQKPPVVTNAPPVTQKPPVTQAPPVTQTPPVTKAPPQSTQPCSTYAEQVLELVNQARANNNLPALALDNKLCAAAEVRAEEVGVRFSHTRPDNSSWMTVLRDFDIQYRVCGENIAINFRDARSVVNAWMNSPGHRANILNPNYNLMGIGRSGNNWGQLFTN